MRILLSFGADASITDQVFTFATINNFKIIFYKERMESTDDSSVKRESRYCIGIIIKGKFQSFLEKFTW